MGCTYIEADAVPVSLSCRRKKESSPDVQLLHRIESLERERDELSAENTRLRVALEYRITAEAGHENSHECN